MIDISFFFKSFTNLAVVALIFLAGSLWAHYCFKNNKGWVLAPAITLSALLFAAWGVYAGVDIDEVEHLHCAWMVNAGCIPFKDFWQHHAPAVWFALAPFFSILKPTALVLPLSRIFFGLVFSLTVFTGWKIARKVWGREASLPAYLLVVFASASMGQYLWARPDQFATLFLLFFLYACLEIPGKRIAPSFMAGAAFGIAASFIFKQYLLFLVPLLVIFKEKEGAPMAKTGAYLLGICCGAMPLVFYLLDKGIIREFIYWVVSYNRKRMIFLVDFPVAVAAIGGWGAYVLFKRYRASGDTKAFVACTAFFLSLASSLTVTILAFAIYRTHHLGLWYMLCAVAGSGLKLEYMARRIPLPLWRSLAAGLFFALVLSPNVIILAEHNYTNFFDDVKVISQEIKYGAGERVLALLPQHPVFAYDAARLYAFWQYTLADQYSEIKKDITDKGVAESIRREKPALVLCILDKRDFLLELSQRMFISKKDYRDLMDYFKTGYTIKMIGDRGYFVRNDKL